MLNKSLLFSKVPKYLYHKDKTPYLVKPKDMSLMQSQYELFSYGVLIGTIFSFIGLAAFLNIKDGIEINYIVWIIFSLATLVSIHLTIKKGIMFCCCVIALAPSILFINLIYESLFYDLNFVKISLLTIILMFLLKYGIRLIKIVFYQNQKLLEGK